MSQGRPPEAPEVVVDDDPEALFALVMDRGWGDGLPVLPPTAERVEAMLAATDLGPDLVLGSIAPRNAQATVLKVAVNAVLAGCRPEQFPVVIAAIRAIADPRLNTNGIQTTTNPVTIAGFVSGPAAATLGFNWGANCLGQGNRANATVGRAIRLAMVNIGGGIPGDLDRATMGQPGKYSFFFAENELDSPWPSLLEAAGAEPGSSAVTMFGAAGTLNLLEPTDSAEDLLEVMAATMRFPTSNDYMYNGEPWLIISPEHAQVLHRGGHVTPATVQEYLWEHARLPLGEFSARVQEYRIRPTWEPLLGPLTADAQIPISEKPSGIRIVVAGGPGTHTTYVPTFGTNRAVTEPLVDSAGRPLRY
ncbi:MAG: hypothetical protein NVS9B1_01810 [Candidatus Dormibacteraceae bacterium]